MSSFTTKLLVTALLLGWSSLLPAWPAPAEPDIRKGYAALQARDYRTAAKYLWEVVQSDSKNTLARRYFACALIGLKEGDRALVELRAAQAVDGIKPSDAAIAARAKALSEPKASESPVEPASPIVTKG